MASYPACLVVASAKTGLKKYQSRQRICLVEDFGEDGLPIPQLITDNCIALLPIPYPLNPTP